MYRRKGTMGEKSIPTKVVPPLSLHGIVGFLSSGLLFFGQWGKFKQGKPFQTISFPRPPNTRPTTESPATQSMTRDELRRVEAHSTALCAHIGKDPLNFPSHTSTTKITTGNSKLSLEVNKTVNEQIRWATYLNACWFWRSFSFSGRTDEHNARTRFSLESRSICSYLDLICLCQLARDGKVVGLLERG